MIREVVGPGVTRVAKAAVAVPKWEIDLVSFCKNRAMATIIRMIFILALCAGISANSNGQGINDYLNKAKSKVNKKGGKKGSLSESDISSGLKEALQVGAKNATAKVSAVNGFFGNSLIKVLMPPEAKKVENTLREVGLGSKVDDAILAMNRAAEDASSKALPIFIDAIKGMSIQDAAGILKGGNDAATQYLKTKTTAALTTAFRPVIQASLDKVDATKYWSKVFTTYNELPMTFNKVNPDLPAYVTERALNGVFLYIAEEETKIRKDPAAQVTDLLKKVFGH
jgi:Protein of unknown function (DUF4197)